LPGERLKQQGPSDSDSGNLQYDNDFWRFSLAVYAQADVAKECLELQRTIGLDINLLLFSAWIGTRAIVLSGKDIEGASRRVADWQKLVVRPLRSVRRELKSLEPVESESFRARVKTIEFEAEQIEQAILFAHSKRLQSFRAKARDAVTVNVKKYIEIITGSRSSDRSAPLLIGAALRLCS
jgi:uncharacterized protein (TIGR02444 family)